MKIIPDPLYLKMQCGANRISDGSARVLPLVASKIPFGRIQPRFRWIVMPSVICAPVVAGFYEPQLMFPIVLIWVISAWVLGSCVHCRTLAEADSDDLVTADQDSGEQ